MYLSSKASDFESDKSNLDVMHVTIKQWNQISAQHMNCTTQCSKYYHIDTLFPKSRIEHDHSHFCSSLLLLRKYQLQKRCTKYMLVTKGLSLYIWDPSGLCTQTIEMKIKILLLEGMYSRLLLFKVYLTDGYCEKKLKISNSNTIFYPMQIYQRIKNTINGFETIHI